MFKINDAEKLRDAYTLLAFMLAYPTLTALWRTVSQRLRKRKNFP